MNCPVIFNWFYLNENKQCVYPKHQTAFGKCHHLLLFCYHESIKVQCLNKQSDFCSSCTAALTDVSCKYEPTLITEEEGFVSCDLKSLVMGFFSFFICFYRFAVNVTAHGQIFLYLNVYTNKYYSTCVSLSLSLHACLLGTLAHPSLHIYRPPSLYAHLADFRRRLSRFHFRGTDRLCLSVRTSGTFVSCL